MSVAGKIGPFEAPDPPQDDLGDVGAKLWETYTKVLHERGELAKHYYQGIYQLCRLEQELMEAQQEADRNGLYNVSDSGFTQRNGIATTIDKLLDQILKFRKEYGLTVSSKPKDAVDKTDDYTSKREKSF